VVNEWVLQTLHDWCCWVSGLDIWYTTVMERDKKSLGHDGLSLSSLKKFTVQDRALPSCGLRPVGVADHKVGVPQNSTQGHFSNPCSDVPPLMRGAHAVFTLYLVYVARFHLPDV
jgi:hypothetical protein